MVLSRATGLQPKRSTSSAATRGMLRQRRRWASGPSDREFPSPAAKCLEAAAQGIEQGAAGHSLEHGVRALGVEQLGIGDEAGDAFGLLVGQGSSRRPPGRVSSAMVARSEPVRSKLSRTCSSVAPRCSAISRCGARHGVRSWPSSAIEREVAFAVEAEAAVVHVGRADLQQGGRRRSSPWHGRRCPARPWSWA
jgi:hypothetical protein